MEDIFGKIVAVFLCVTQLFLLPVYLYGENLKRAEQTYIIAEITYYVDNVRNTGIIDEKQYNNMRDKIYSLGQKYSINIIHSTHIADKEGDRAIYFNDMQYEEQIENALDDNGVYYLEKNDYFYIQVDDKAGNMVACYGGSVKNEAY